MPRKGQRLSEEAKQKIREAMLGKPSWNKGIPMSEKTKERLRASKQGKSIHTEKSIAAIKKSLMGNKYAMKERVTYRSLHAWLRANKPNPGHCECCGSTGKLEIASINRHNYSRNLDDYMYLCVKCHRNLDGSKFNLPQYGGIV